MTFLREFAHGTYADMIAIDSLELDDASFLTQTTNKRESDILYRAKIGEQDIYFYILLEMQSSQDYRMPFRLLEYQLEIWRRYDVDHYASKSKKNYKLPIIQPIILYNGKRKWQVPVTFHGILDGIEDYPARETVLNFHYDLVDVSRFEPTALKEHTSLISRVFLVEQSKNLADLFQGLQYKADVVFKTAEDIRLFKQWMQYSAKSQYHGKIKDWIDELELGGVAMIESNLNHLLANEQRKKTQLANESRQAGIAEGRQAGIAEGRQAGIAEGKLEAAKSLIDILSDEVIAEKLDLPLLTVQKLRQK